MKTFNKLQIATIKRTAQNVAQYVNKKEAIDKKIAALEEEKKSIQPLIDAFQGPIKAMTGGYTTEDLVVKETVRTGKFDSKTGKEIVSTRFVLKYPDTVVPPTIEAPTTEGLPGSDFDLDKESFGVEQPECIDGPAPESTPEDLFFN